MGEASEGQIDTAVKAAQKAFAGWAATPPKDRAALLLKVADRIEADAATFAEIESKNCGKPYNAVLNDEIPAIADVFRFFAGAARTMHGAAAGEYLAGFTSMIRRDPIGVVASIAPWNYPLMMAAWKLAPALAAGNTGGDQALRADAAVDSSAGDDPCGTVPAGRRQRGLRTGQHGGRAADRASRRRDDLADGRCLDRREGAAGCAEGRQAHASRAGRQGAGDRVRRCGSGGCCGRRAHVRLLQRRPGLHRCVPHLRGREDLRQAGGGSQSARVQRIKVGHAEGGGRRDGAAHQRRSSASGLRASSIARRRSGTSR